MIALFTSVKKGGLLQLAIQLTESLSNLGYDAVAFIPEGAISSNEKCLFYKDQKAITPQSHVIKNIADLILSQKPSSLILLEHNSINAGFLAIYLKGKLTVYMMMHDVQTHPTRNMIYFIKERLKRVLVKRAIESVSNLIFLSRQMQYEYLLQYKNTKLRNTLLLPLGAHLPKCVERKPIEIEQGLSFFLFFGRIDKYKGLYRLLEAFLALSIESPIKLIVAGKGTLTKDEKQLVEKLQEKDRLIMLNRFIGDDELLWLFNKCKFTVLPYVEASQSGILPMSYYYGKAVVVSDIPGLTQFVIDNTTGFIFRNIDDLTAILHKMISEGYSEMLAGNCKKYYETNLDWEKNLKKIVDYL